MSSTPSGDTDLSGQVGIPIFKYVYVCFQIGGKIKIKRFKYVYNNIHNIYSIMVCTNVLDKVDLHLYQSVIALASERNNSGNALGSRKMLNKLFEQPHYI